MSYIGNSPGVASQRVETAFTATASQTVFTPSSGYTLGYCDVYYNGVKLVNGDDYTAADGVSITLATAAAAGDSVVVVASFPRGLTDGYLKAEADAKYVALTGDQTVAGVKTFSGSATIVNGNLGVGTSSVLGNSTFNAALGIAVRNQSTSMGYFQSYNANAGTDLKTWRFGGNGSGNLVFETVNDAYSSATNRLTLDASGNLGIGVTSPAGRLDVGSSGSTKLFVRDRSDSDRGIYLDSGTAATGLALVSTNTASRALGFATNDTERARIDSSGKFMVGGTAGESRSNVFSGGSNGFSSGTLPPGMTLYAQAGDGYGSMLSFKPDTGAQGVSGIAGFRVNGYQTDLRFYTNNTNSANAFIERGKFTAAGDFQLYITAAKDGQVQWYEPANNIVRAFVYANGVPELVAQCGGSGGVKLTSGATSWVSASDIRNKDIIEPITNAVQKVGSLSSVIYSFKDDVEQTRRVGLIAQEVLAVLPEAVYVPTKEEEMLGVRYTEVVPLMVAAIKEQQAIIEQLRADVQALKEAA